MTKSKQYIPHQNQGHGAQPPTESPEGPWLCITNDDDRDYEEFLEVHRSARGDGVVFRVSEFNRGRIDLGQCVILDKEGVRKVRDRLDELLARIEALTGEA